MGIASLLRDLQDLARNAGWRIQWIPWTDSGKPETVYNTKLTLITGLGGAALFVGGIGMTLLMKYASNNLPYWLFPATLAVGVCGLPIILAGRIYASWHKRRDWQCIAARVVDREIRNCSREWGYRLLCTFTWDGKEYKVTPESSHIVGFTSEAKVIEYLTQRISPNGDCELLIDPKNPLHTMFGTK
jgi:hypothetical protein